jgi:hypothetical protein
MIAYQIINTTKTMRLAYLQATARMALQPPGVNFPYITYSREIAEKVAAEYGGKVMEVGTQCTT